MKNNKDPWLIHKGMICEEGDTPTPKCHASTIVETTGARFVAAWFGGAHEGAEDVGIWTARLEGERWQAPVEVATGIQYVETPGRIVRHPCWNPVLCRGEGPVVHLFFKVGPNPRSWWGEIMTSTDSGQTWKPPQRLPDGILGPIKNKALTLSAGTILCPSSTESTERGWDVHFEFFHGPDTVWRRTEDVDRNGIEAIQPTLLRHPSGTLQALCRTRGGGMIAETRSDDSGRTWSPLRRMDLPHPGSGIDAVTLTDGRHLLVYNHTVTARTPLNLAISANGVDWQMIGVLEETPGEYSYPAIVQASDGLVHITYTWKRVAIRHVVVDPKQLP